MKRLLVYVFAVTILGGCGEKKTENIETPTISAEYVMDQFLYKYSFDPNLYEDSTGHKVSEMKIEEAQKLVESYGYNGNSVITIAIKLQELLKDKYLIEWKSNPQLADETNESFEAWKKRQIKIDSLYNDKSYMDSLRREEEKEGR